MDATTSNPSLFIFPVLKNSDILQCMAELNIELSKSELMEPHRHKDRVRKVFLQLLEVCCGLTESDFSPQLVFESYPSALNTLNFPELHDDSFAELKFFNKVRTCMETCGLHNFGWKDLHVPTSKRFRWHLSAAINMAKFREDQLKLYGELNEPRAELIMGLEEVNDENVHLNKQLEATHMDQQTKSKEVVEVLDECAELEMEIARNNKLQAAKREEATILKKMANDLKDEIASASLALEEAEAEEKHLSAKVVSSPGRRKSTLDHKRILLESERQESAVVEEKLALTKVKISNVTQAQQDVTLAASLAQEAQEEMQKHTLISAEVKVATLQVDGHRKETTQTLDEKKECERSLHRTQEKINNVRKQSKVKMDAAKDAIEQAKVQLLGVEKDRRDGMARVEAGEREVFAMETKIDEETKRTEVEIADMVAEFHETERVLLEQDNQIMVAIGCA